MKKAHWGVVTFALGNTILILTTCVISFYTPHLLMEKDHAEDEISALDERLWTLQQMKSEYEIWLSKSMDIETTMELFDVLKMRDTPQFRKLEDDLKISKSTALEKLIKFTGSDDPDPLTLHKLSADDLEDHRIRLLEKSYGMMQRIKTEKSKIEDLNDDRYTQISFANFLTALFQTIAISLVSMSDFLSKMKEEEAE